MYYCKARYYVPLWKRWLTPDNPKYLDENDINNLNLFVYCGNDPINKYDPNGNSPKWLEKLTETALYVVLALTAVTVVTPIVNTIIPVVGSLVDTIYLTTTATIICSIPLALGIAGLYVTGYLLKLSWPYIKKFFKYIWKGLEKCLRIISQESFANLNGGDISIGSQHLMYAFGGRGISYTAIYDDGIIFEGYPY